MVTNAGQGAAVLQGVEVDEPFFSDGDMDANGIDDFVVGANEQDEGVVYLYLNDYGYCPE